MRTPIVVLALAASLAGCALSGSQIEDAPRYQPLDARIFGPVGTGTLDYTINKPAYVALFEIVPGVGTSLIYPRPGMGSLNDRRFAGIHSIPRHARVNRELYLPVSQAFNQPPPRYYFLIASEEPLRLDRFGTYGTSLRSAMGFRHFAANNAFNAMERIAEVALPNPAAETWTADYYFFWPSVIHNAPARRLVAASCNGRTFWIAPENFAAFGALACPDRVATPGALVPEDEDERPDAERGKPRGAEPASEAGARVRERLREATERATERGEADKRRPGLDRDGRAERRGATSATDARQPLRPQTGRTGGDRAGSGSARPARPSSGSAGSSPRGLPSTGSSRPSTGSSRPNGGSSAPVDRGDSDG